MMMREVITREKIARYAGQKEITFPAGTILTQAAKEWLKEHGVKVTFVPAEEAPLPEPAPAGEPNRAVVTVLGHDKVGIIAGVSGVLASVNVNILDISQTVLQGLFVMVMIVDLAGCRVDFATLRKMLEEKGEELELKINIQHEDVFRFMHRI